MSLIPRNTNALAKDARTGEGILEWATATGIAGLSLIDPSALPHKESAILVTTIAVLKGVRRTVLKGVLIQKGAGFGGPAAATGELAKIEQGVTRLEQSAGNVLGSPNFVSASASASGPLSYSGPFTNMPTLPTDTQELASPPPVEQPPGPGATIPGRAISDGPPPTPADALPEPGAPPTT